MLSYCQIRPSRQLEGTCRLSSLATRRPSLNPPPPRPPVDITPANNRATVPSAAMVNDSEPETGIPLQLPEYEPV